MIRIHAFQRVVPLILLVLGTTLAVPTTACAQGDEKTPGKIVFEDETEVEFFDVARVHVTPQERVYADREEPYWPVFYQNSWRVVYLEDIKAIRILTFKVVDKIVLMPATVYVETDTGVSAEYELNGMNFIEVEIRDDLSGEVTEQIFRFANDGHLNIREIVFY